MNEEMCANAACLRPSKHASICRCAKGEEPIPFECNCGEPHDRWPADDGSHYGTV